MPSPNSDIENPRPQNHRRTVVPAVLPFFSMSIYVLSPGNLLTYKGPSH